MKCRIERMPGLDDAESDLRLLTHHGANDELGYLAVRRQSLGETFPPVLRWSAAMAGMYSARRKGAWPTLDSCGRPRTELPDSCSPGFRPAKATNWRAWSTRSSLTP
jgi:hypothetical protein